MLKRVYADDLPYKKNHLQVLKKLMIVEQTPQYTIRAKTGWTARVESQIGWYVGYVETSDKVWFFAVNLDFTDKKQARFRKEIAMEGLKSKGIL
jgi:beta-lactamase class D